MFMKTKEVIHCEAVDAFDVLPQCTMDFGELQSNEHRWRRYGNQEIALFICSVLCRYICTQARKMD